MAAPCLVELPAGTFWRWMRAQGSLGDQHKVPRVTNDRFLADRLLAVAAPRLARAGATARSRRQLIGPPVDAGDRPARSYRRSVAPCCPARRPRPPPKAERPRAARALLAARRMRVEWRPWALPAEVSDAPMARRRAGRPHRATLPGRHRDPDGLEAQVRAGQGHGPALRSTACCTARCTIPANYGFIPQTFAPTTTRSTSWCSARSRWRPLCMLRARAIGVMHHERRPGRGRQDHRRPRRRPRLRGTTSTSPSCRPIA